MRLILGALAIVFTVFLGFQLYRLYKENRLAGQQVKKLDAEIEAFKKENNGLKADISYFSDLENLAKELKSKFDYRRPGEKLIKIQ
ncbi:MAG: septum formation initiator family protein [Patescibacteria group bacterium]